MLLVWFERKLKVKNSNKKLGLSFKKSRKACTLSEVGLKIFILIPAEGGCQILCFVF